MSEQRHQALREKLRGEVLAVGYRDLRQHAARGALILVADDLDLLDATLAVAVDDHPQVKQWLDSERLCRPSEAQLSAWEREPDKRFSYLIAQPFVLAKPLTDAADA